MSTWYITVTEYLLDLTRIAFTIDLSFVANQQVQFQEEQNNALRRRKQSFKPKNTTINVQSLFRANMPQRFFEAILPLIVGQIQQGYKLRQFLPAEYFVPPKTPVATRRSQFLILSPARCIEYQYALTAPDDTRIDDVPASNALTTNNLYQYGQYVEKALVPTVIILAEYAHTISPLVWEELTNLLVAAAHSKHLQVRFASLTAFMALLQPQVCIRAVSHKKQNVDEQRRRQRHHNSKEQQPIWSNEFFYACLSKYIPSISTLMQDESLHVQRLTQNLISLVEHIGHEPFSKYLA